MSESAEDRRLAALLADGARLTKLIEKTKVKDGTKGWENTKTLVGNAACKLTIGLMS